MNLHKQCHSCGDFFKSDLLSFYTYCSKPECKKKAEHRLQSIKKRRMINMDYFDIYDLDLVHKIYENGNIVYERVCRFCGSRLLNKNGKYSHHKRYCNKRECNGYDLFDQFDVATIVKNYARKIRDDNLDIIKKMVKDIIPEEAYKEKKTYWYDPLARYNPERFTICELCGKLLRIFESYSYYHKNNIEVCEIHHKIPVHTLTWDNIHLIWDINNLICLCTECHNKQDHKLKKVKYKNFNRITEYLK